MKDGISVFCTKSILLQEKIGLFLSELGKVLNSEGSLRTWVSK